MPLGHGHVDDEVVVAGCGGGDERGVHVEVEDDAVEVGVPDLGGDEVGVFEGDVSFFGDVFTVFTFVEFNDLGAQSFCEAEEAGEQFMLVHRTPVY